MIAETSPILSLLFAKGLGVKTFSGLVDRLVQSGLSMNELVNLPTDRLVREFGLRRNVAENIRAAHDQAEKVARELEHHGIQVLIRGIEPYPARLVEVLRENAPPVLFARGCLSVLDKMAVGFCGSRNASEKGIRVAGKSARLLAVQDVNIVSGYAKGVDLSAHRAALEAGGATTIVLAEGILHFREKREIKALLNDENHLVLSEFSPRLPWAAQSAMQRNRTICGLSDAIIVIESGMTGGTFAAAEAALKLRKPLFVAEYAQPAASAEGNQYFLQRGATPLRGDRTGQPNLQRVFEALGMSDGAASPEHVATNRPEPTSESVGERGESYSPNATVPKPDGIGTAREHRMQYPKRLIEVDLPIRRISAHSRREKSIRHGHISTLRIWWARRPLAACRAVICAALWPDPADPLCPRAFRDEAARLINAFAKKADGDMKLLATSSEESKMRWAKLAKNPLDSSDSASFCVLRGALLDFIADFANWDNSTVKEYLDTSRALTQVAHEALGGAPGTRPLVVDPFAGGGSIPLEALRVGADAFASDLNPVAVLLNKVVLEYIPKYGQRLADEVRKWGEWIKKEAEKELGEFYPKDPDGATPIAYLWARTIKCEGPGCGAEVPLTRTFWLAKKANRSIALQLLPRPGPKRVDFQIIAKQRSGWANQADPEETIADPKFDGTVRRGSATCPCCGYTTQNDRVRKQLAETKGGAATARLLAVVTVKPEEVGRFYRLPTDSDLCAAREAANELNVQARAQKGGLSLVPDELIPAERPSPNARGLSAVTRMGVASFGDLFAPRQALSLATFGRLVRTLASSFPTMADEGVSQAATVCLALAVDRQADSMSSLATWSAGGEFIRSTFTRQALPIVWDFVECCPLADASGNWEGASEWVSKAIEATALGTITPGSVTQASATEHPLPNDAAQAVVTDPPYYDAVPYADLSEFFYVWLRRTLANHGVDSLSHTQLPKDEEAIWNPSRIYSKTGKPKDERFYEQQMRRAFEEARRVVAPSGIGVVVFAHKSTAGWEAVLQALIDAGWIATGSWPIDTEREVRTNAIGTASLASSVHLVCRPRENSDGSVRTDDIGDWRNVLQELPRRIHEWMPRLAEEGVVGADAIFACLGPALEIFSRYSRVEKASGEVIALREYLEQVWAAVSNEALSLIFKDTDAASLEPDARLTAMWLWTLGGGKEATAEDAESAEEDGEEGQEIPSANLSALRGFVLEYDAARKIAQGLGVHLDQIQSIVEVKGNKARLCSVAERTRHLFGKDEAAPGATARRKRKPAQTTLFEDLDESEAVEGGWTEMKGPALGETVLDRVHQAMILFAAGRSEAVKRFLVEDGAGTDARFWKLAQSLSALYPKDTDEKRWVDGVLARKKGLGL